MCIFNIFKEFPKAVCLKYLRILNSLNISLLLQFQIFILHYWKVTQWFLPKNNLKINMTVFFKLAQTHGIWVTFGFLSHNLVFLQIYLKKRFFPLYLVSKVCPCPKPFHSHGLDVRIYTKCLHILLQHYLLLSASASSCSTSNRLIFCST